MATYSLIQNGESGLSVRTTLNSLLDDINNGVYIGPEGPEGPEGPIGETGATGATGLGFNFRGLWNSQETYFINDVVEWGSMADPDPYRNSLFIALVDNPNTDPIFDVADNEAELGLGQGSQWALMLKAPQGPQGIQGETGPQGEQGIQGETGATGPAGATGTFLGKLYAGQVFGSSFTIPDGGETYEKFVELPVPFEDSYYSVSVMASVPRTWSIDNIAPNGFVVKSNSSTPLQGVVQWISTEWTIKPYILVVGNRDKDDDDVLRNARKYDINGNLVFGVDTPNNNTNAAIITDGSHFYTGGTGFNNQFNITKYDLDGNLIWSRQHGEDINGIAVDLLGNVYTGGWRIDGVIPTTRKYDANGNLLWSVDHGGPGSGVFGITVDKDGNVYTGGNVSNFIDGVNNTTRKYDTDGNLIWSVNHEAQVRAIAVDKDGNVYTGGARISNITTRKYDTNGNLIWSVDHGGTVGGIAVDKNYNVYTYGRVGTNPVTNEIKKYDINGNQLFSSVIITGLLGGGIAVDKDGSIYTGDFSLSQTGPVRIFNNDGVLITEFLVPGGIRAIDLLPANKGPFLS